MKPASLESALLFAVRWRIETRDPPRCRRDIGTGRSCNFRRPQPGRHFRRHTNWSTVGDFLKSRPGFRTCHPHTFQCNRRKKTLSLQLGILRTTLGLLSAPALLPVRLWGQWSLAAVRWCTEARDPPRCRRDTGTDRRRSRRYRRRGLRLHQHTKMRTVGAFHQCLRDFRRYQHRIDPCDLRTEFRCWRSADTLRTPAGL